MATVSWMHTYLAGKIPYIKFEYKFLSIFHSILKFPHKDCMEVRQFFIAEFQIASKVYIMQGRENNWDKDLELWFSFAQFLNILCLCLEN